jgi:hypothetical protein
VIILQKEVKEMNNHIQIKLFFEHLLEEKQISTDELKAAKILPEKED